ncbi:hypothetical protein SAY86_030607 [Trapa natans]|uniref:Uncharacterized protein n=1 Tax=Trapa natans TaxID=22666 RepID=A0AAN7M391_TRANT|nr:hypothetical protein SAY86_030607 [Trapa natans]
MKKHRRTLIRFITTDSGINQRHPIFDHHIQRYLTSSDIAIGSFPPSFDSDYVESTGEGNGHGIFVNKTRKEGTSFSALVEPLEPAAKILSLAIKSWGRPDILLSVPDDGKPKGLWFNLKEDSQYNIKFTFQVKNNITYSLKCTITTCSTLGKIGSSSSRSPFQTL